jgi:hypothetical protein
MRSFLAALACGALLAVASACGTAATPVTSEAQGSATADSGPATTGGPRADTGTTEAGHGGTTTTSASGASTTTSPGGASTTTTGSGSNGGGGGGGGSISDADFQAKALALCKSFSDKASNLFSGDTATQADIDGAVSVLRDFETQLKAIGIPAGKQQQAAAFYTALDNFINALAKDAPQLVGTNAPPSSVEKEIEDLGNQFNTAADAFGLQACGGGDSSTQATG